MPTRRTRDGVSVSGKAKSAAQRLGRRVRAKAPKADAKRVARRLRSY